MHYVIIGRSAAGISGARAIRKGNADAEITMISAERVNTYYRPMIPLLINGKKVESEITYPDDPAEENRINTIFDIAAGLDVRSKEVLLHSGKKIKFDKLLIATGSTPLIPEIFNIKAEWVFTLRTMEDAIKIRNAVSGAKNAVVIGGGFVGIKAATALKSYINVTIIEKLERILYQRVDSLGAEIISRALKDEGIKIITSDSVIEIIRDRDKLKAVRLASGSIINAEILIIAVGVRPDIGMFKDSGIKIGKGIQVNELLETNISDIYAAGDDVEFRDLLTGMPSVSALWTNALEMGRIAGANMTGENIRYPGFLGVMNATEIADIPIIAVGIIEPEEKGYEVITEDGIGVYRKFVLKDELLAGALLIGDIKNAGIYTNLIKNRIPIGRLKERFIEGTLCYANFIREGLS